MTKPTNHYWDKHVGNNVYRKFVDTTLKVDCRKLKRTVNRDVYFLLLADQTCIIGPEFTVMKRWRTNFKDKKIVDMYKTGKRINSGVTSLSKFIEYDPNRPTEPLNSK